MASNTSKTARASVRAGQATGGALSVLGEFKYVIPLNGGKHAYVRNLTNGKTNHLRTDSDAFVEEIRMLAARRPRHQAPGRVRRRWPRPTRPTAGTSPRSASSTPASSRPPDLTTAFHRPVTRDPRSGRRPVAIASVSSLATSAAAAVLALATEWSRMRARGVAVLGIDDVAGRPAA